MRGSSNTAITAALDLARSPTLAAVMRNQPIPSDLLDVIRVAAGSEETLGRLASEMRVDACRLRSASETYLQKVLFFPNAGRHRTLGVEPSATRETARENFKWLLMWLHPDRGGMDWHQAFAARVIEAWNALEGKSYQATDYALKLHRHRPYRPPWIARPLPDRRAVQMSRRVVTSALLISTFAVLLAAAFVIASAHL